MTAIDRYKPLTTITVSDTQIDGNRALALTSTLDNNKRHERTLLRFAGTATITASGKAIQNRGSILGAVGTIGFTDGGTDIIAGDARLLRFFAECMAPAELVSTRLATPIQGPAVTVAESVPIWYASPRSINANTTKYVEVNKQLALQVFITMNRRGTGVGGSTVNGLIDSTGTMTLTGVTCTVEQVYDDLVGTPPDFTVFVRQIVVPVTQNVNGLKIDLRGTRYVRAICIQQDTDQGEVSDIITSFILRGDNASVVGDAQFPFIDWVEHSQEDFGGGIAQAEGYACVDFQRYARRSAWWNPNQDTNLRIEANVTTSGGARTNSVIRVLMVEYQRTAATAKQLQIRKAP